MKIPVIKKLIEEATIEQLQAAEESIMNEETPQIEIKGDDEGEQLTHVFAAIYILRKMKSDGVDFKSALREYTQKVRTSIS